MYWRYHWSSTLPDLENKNSLRLSLLSQNSLYRYWTDLTTHELSANVLICLYLAQVSLQILDRSSDSIITCQSIVLILSTFQNKKKIWLNLPVGTAAMPNLRTYGNVSDCQFLWHEYSSFLTNPQVPPISPYALHKRNKD